MADDFFEDDVVAEKPEPSQKQALKGQKAQKVKSGGKKTTTQADGGETGNGGFTFTLGQKVDLIWVIAITIIAFTIGFVAHASFFKPSTTETSNQINNAGTGTAPALTEEQIKNFESQGLPADHPSVDGSSGSTTQSGTNSPAQGESSATPGN